jgi:hypothetical protein
MRSRSNVKLFLLLGLLFTFIIPQSVYHAYGHGLSGDMVSASIGDRNLTLRVDMRPSFLLAEAPQDATIEMRLYDTNTDKNIQQVTYLVNLYKGDKLLMRDWFYASDGDLFIKVRPMDQPNVVVNAPKEQTMDAWIGSKEAPALAQGPIFLEGGLYHFAIEIFTIDFVKTILKDPVKYDAYVSIGETTTYSVTDGREISVRTYYDKIQNVSLDEENKLVKFSMPINWDLRYLAQVPLIHEEVVIPKSFTGLVAEKYTGVLNGIRLPEGAVMADTTNPDETIVHYMIPNQQLLAIAAHVNSMPNGDSKHAEFTLAPGTVDIGIPLPKGGSSGQVMAMSRSFHTMMSWSPTVIEPVKPASFTFSIMDIRSGAMINDATYDFVLVKDGQEIFRKQGQTIAGIGSEQFTFKESQQGSVTVTLENINNTGESADFNIQVVPEFPIGVLMIMGGIVAAMLAITRFRNKSLIQF